MNKKKKKLLEEQRKLLKQKNEQDKLLKQQNDEHDKLLEEYEEENILKNIAFGNIDKGPIAELTPLRRDIKFENIDNGPIAELTPLRRDIEKPTPSPSKISTPITKSRKHQGLAAGEQSTTEIMKNDLKVSKDIIKRYKDINLKKFRKIYVWRRS